VSGCPEISIQSLKEAVKLYPDGGGVKWLAQPFATRKLRSGGGISYLCLLILPPLQVSSYDHY
jgi:hypothetical protein